MFEHVDNVTRKNKAVLLVFRYSLRKNPEKMDAGAYERLQQEHVKVFKASNATISFTSGYLF